MMLEDWRGSRGGAHLGLMHLLATNLIVWMWAVEIESLHILHYAQKSEDETRPNNI